MFGLCLVVAIILLPLVFVNGLAAPADADADADRNNSTIINAHQPGPTLRDHEDRAYFARLKLIPYLSKTGMLPTSMSMAMHERVVELRRVLERHNELLDELRGGVEPISNNSALVKCSANKDLHRAKVVGHVFTDGLGHSLSSYLRQLYIAEMYGCRSTLPTRYAVLRNYVFVPWDTIPVPEMTAGNKSNASQPNFQPAMYWLDHDPTQFLYCHQKHATAAIKKQLRTKEDMDKFVASGDYRRNMACYKLFADPWRVLCNAALGAECDTERQEVSRGRSSDRTSSNTIADPAHTHGENASRQLSEGQSTRQYIILDKVLPRTKAKNAQVPIEGLPGPETPQAHEAIGQVLNRTARSFWDTLKETWNQNLLRMTNESVSGSNHSWDCGFKDDTLDVTIHMRRGDLYGSNKTRDQERYVSSEYYRRLLHNLTLAWKASPKLKSMYPNGLRFQAHSESIQLPPPYGKLTKLREFDNLVFEPQKFYVQAARSSGVVVCPQGMLRASSPTNSTGDADSSVRLQVCLNLAPLFSMYCMASSDLFVGGDSYFSTLVAVSRNAPTIVARNFGNFAQGLLCEGMSICNVTSYNKSSEETQPVVLLRESDLSVPILEDVLGTSSLRHE